MTRRTVGDEAGRGANQGRRRPVRARAAVVPLLTLVLVGAACSSDEVEGATGTTRADVGGSSTSTPRPPRTTAPSPPSTGVPRTSTSTSASTSLPFLDIDEPTGRVGDLADLGICTPLAADVVPELQPGQFVPRAVRPDAQMAGASIIAGRPFTSVTGDPDLVIVDAAPAAGAGVTMVVGYLDRTTGSFERRLGLDRCPIVSTLVDGDSLWVVGIVSQSGATDAYVLVELDLRTGARTWSRQLAEPPRWWRAEGGRLQLALGGDRDAIQEPFDTIPFGIDTIEAGTGRLVDRVDVEAVRPDAVLPSDDSLWVRSPRADLGGGPFRQLDPMTGAVLRTFEVPTRTSPIVHRGALWWTTVEGVLERRPLDTLAPEIVSYAGGPSPAAQLQAGDSGIWVLRVTGPTFTTVTLTRVDPETVIDRGSFSYETYRAVQDRSGSFAAVTPRVVVDAYGVHAEEWTQRWDGTGEPPAEGRAVYEVVVP